MPSKLYTIWLNPTTYIVVDFQSLEGEILAFVVRLVRVVGNEHLDVARYDTAHGRPNRDLVSPRGRLRKKSWLKNADFKESLTYAIEDFKNNYESYISQQR